jgi:hypothetical protein
MKNSLTSAWIICILIENEQREVNMKRKIPPKGSGRPPKYPFAEMKKGDSLDCEGKYHNVVNAAYSFGLRHECKFTARKIENEITRVWRTA